MIRAKKSFLTFGSSRIISARRTGQSEKERIKAMKIEVLSKAPIEAMNIEYAKKNGRAKYGVIYAELLNLQADQAIKARLEPGQDKTTLKRMANSVKHHVYNHIKDKTARYVINDNNSVTFWLNPRYK